MKDIQVWHLVDLPPNCKTVGSKWIFKKKNDIDGNVHTYKACLVAKGYTQTYGVDYEETFSPVADIRAIRILIDIEAFYDYEIWQIDVKAAFLNGYLDEDIYMVNPEAELRVDCYCEAGFETDRDDIKSLTRYLNNKAALEARMEVVWIRKFIFGLGIVPITNKPIKMFCDNSAALLIANEPEVQRGARHYHRKYLYVRECIEQGEINLLEVHTDNNLAISFTKALPKGKLTQHAMSMRLCLASSFM
ncbi:retrotransposon protein, putative, ty1-copia subclass [Tanacetum coccineum]